MGEGIFAGLKVIDCATYIAAPAAANTAWANAVESLNVPLALRARSKTSTLSGYRARELPIC